MKFTLGVLIREFNKISSKPEFPIMQNPLSWRTPFPKVTPDVHIPSSYQKDFHSWIRHMQTFHGRNKDSIVNPVMVIGGINLLARVWLQLDVPAWLCRCSSSNDCGVESRSLSNVINDCPLCTFRRPCRSPHYGESWAKTYFNLRYSIFMRAIFPFSSLLNIKVFLYFARENMSTPKESNEVFIQCSIKSLQFVIGEE